MEAQEPLTVPDRVLDFLSTKKTLTLATAGADGVPHATTLVYVNDGPSLYFWTHGNAETARLLEENPIVGFAIDEYSEDWRETRGLQGTGDCEPVSDGAELAKVGELFGERFPDLRPGASGAVTFYRVTPRRLDFIDNTTGGPEPAPDEYRRSSVLDVSGPAGS